MSMHSCEFLWLLTKARAHYPYAWDDPAIVAIWPIKHMMRTASRLVRLDHVLPDGRMMGYDEGSNMLVISRHLVTSSAAPIRSHHDA